MMDPFNQPRAHFRVESGPCHEILMRWREARTEIESEYFAFAKSAGGMGFYPGSDDNVGNAVAINAVIFEGDLPKGWKPRKWKSFAGLERGKTAAWPDTRSTDGKAALAAIKALPLRPSSYGPCDAIGFPSSLSYTKEGTNGSMTLGVFETLKVGWIEDVLYVSLPDEKRVRLGMEAEGYTVEGDLWSPLPGMVRVLKEEVDLDYARHKAKVAADKVPA